MAYNILLHLPLMLLFCHFSKGDNFHDFLVAPWKKTFTKGIYSLRKDFAPMEANFFFLKVDLIEKEMQMSSERISLMKFTLTYLFNIWLWDKGFHQKLPPNM